VWWNLSHVLCALVASLTAHPLMIGKKRSLNEHRSAALCPNLNPSLFLFFRRRIGLYPIRSAAFFVLSALVPLAPSVSVPLFLCFSGVCLCFSVSLTADSLSDAVPLPEHPVGLHCLSAVLLFHLRSHCSASLLEVSISYSPHALIVPRVFLCPVDNTFGICPS